MGDGRNLRRALVLACLAHAGGFAAVRLAPPRPAQAAAVADVEGTFLSIETVPVVAEPSSVTPPDAPTAAIGALAHLGRAGGAAAVRAGQAGSVMSSGDGVAAADPADATPNVLTSPNDEGWTFHSTKVDLGIDPKKRAMLAAGGPGAADAPPSRIGGSKTGGVVEALDAKDGERGLGRGGVVNAAIHDAVQASSVMGTAIFAVTIDGSGAIRVTVSSASQDEVGWARLNESIRASVAARKDQIRMPPSGGGLRIAVQAEAKEQFPNGVKPQDLGTKGVAKGLSVTETKDKVDINLPQLAVVHRGKVCDVGLSAIPPFIAGGCDPSNIGAVAQRIVTARIVSETRL